MVELMRQAPEQYQVQSLIDFYNRNVEKYRDDIRSVAWGSRKSQKTRFEALSQIGNLEGRTILDVGCGLGDFYGWLKGRYSRLRYTGIDISPSMIEVASSNYPGVKFETTSVFELQRMKPLYDYVFASGIFNRRIPRHKCFVRDTIKKMFALSKSGIAFNIMSKKADFMDKKEYYADPGEMLNFCLGLGRKVILRHDYMPHDFTVYIYK